MPYSITRHAEHLVLVVLEGHLTLDHAEHYFTEMWDLLDTCGPPTDLMVDGRRIAGADHGARRRTEQVAHHPHLGHLAFIVGELHLLLFAPLVKMVSGVGLFGDEHEALDYLCAARGRLPVVDLAMPRLPPLPTGHQEDHHAPSALPSHPAIYTTPLGHGQRTSGGRPAPIRPLPLPPTSRLKGTPLYARGPRYAVEGQRAGAGDGEAE